MIGERAPGGRRDRAGRVRTRRVRRAGLLARIHPPQAVVLGFGLAVIVGAALLLMPVARAGAGSATPLEAVFTATSAVCVTGLVVVDTPTYWSGFGQTVILILIQIGGLGIMTVASLLGLLTFRRLGLRSRITAATETKTVTLGEVRGVIVRIVRMGALIEILTAATLTVRLMTTYDEPLPRAAWLGLFHSISAFNNAGFALYSDSLVRFGTDPWINLPIAGAVILGGVGFPVLVELRRELRHPSRWTMHTKITLIGTAVLLVGGTAFMLAAEWSNPRTLGPLDVPGKLLAGFFQGVMPRTAGFNSVDVAEMNTGTWLGSDVLMFIGGGSAGTAGGIKITTFTVLLLAIYSEVRGERDTVAFNRRIPPSAHRQALSVALLGVAVVVVSAVGFALTTPFSLDALLFEIVSAFSTVGLSTGITAQLASPHQLVLVALMFVGRTGTITLATALALRHRGRLYRFPDERPIIG